MTGIEGAEAQLYAIIQELEAVKRRMVNLHKSVPLSADELNPLVEVDVVHDRVAAFHGSLEDAVDRLESLINGFAKSGGDEE